MFEGEVALVTGGSSGIGRATAVAFAAEGAKVVVASRRSEESGETVRMVTDAGGEAFFVQADVSISADVQRMVAQTVERFGKLNYAFNNAGVGGNMVPTAEYPEDVFDKVVSINLKGVFLSMKYELPYIVATKGAIVNMSSVAGLVGGRVGVAYYASKHGVVGMTKAAALEYADKGVRINAVAPAVIKTPLTEGAGFLNKDTQLGAMMLARHPVGRLGEPEEVAQAVIWLCSKRASFTTGHTLPIDGGVLIP
ncbi:short-chain dehydrogenase [Ramlibacter tataouinensis]|uniref:Short-chain dehydrogenase n=2 Tax=Ramlibacter tataouinensis TaxID=94132 RepID=A0A127JZX0_9BURK|nr:short-chain dehydrogenase [Ramlibacter tataouinensis]